jgi:mannosylglycerate hydrolase
MSDSKFVAHVVSHTHWDREWYRTFEAFRMRLVALVDALLDLLDADPRYGPFYLDGQMRPVEDYAEIKPGQLGGLRLAFASGRLYAGPWYVQPDEFLVSGEAIIRNLLIGRQTARAWGTGADIGYAPDAFGHTAQMPQLLRGFGIGNVVLFRGITTDQVPSEFAWRSPDGSEVLCIKMPDDNAYSNWFYRLRDTLADTDRNVPLDAERVVADVAELLEDSIRERPTTANLLWMDGVDHIFPQPRTPEIIALINERMGDRVTVKSAGLAEFIEAVEEARPPLPVVEGELRISNRAWKLQALLTHVASSRINLKQRIHACETLLERWAEPWSAIACALDARMPATVPDLQPFVRYAWKTLLLNHPHDSICGCSIDQVHRDMLPRFDQVEQVGELVTRRSLQALADSVNTSWTPGDDHSPSPLAALVAFNPLGWRRTDAITADVYIPMTTDCETVGVYRDGEEVPAYVEPLSSCHTLDQAAHDIPVGHGWKRYRVTFRAEVAGFGISVYHVAPKVAAVRLHGEDGLSVGQHWIANGLVRVQATQDGTLRLDDLRTGRSYAGLLAFEDGGDHGDGYNYIPPREDRVIRTTDSAPDGSDVHIQAVTTGCGVALRIEHLWYLPAKRDGDRRDGTEQAQEHILCEVTLSPGSPRVDIDVIVDNGARDHRLRVLFPTGAADARAYSVEQAFCVVERAIRKPDCTGWREPQPGTGPQKTWVDVSGSHQGLTVINQGLPECEVLDDADRTVAITLLRCTGQGVGLPEEQLDGQMPGHHAFRLALLPHVGSWREARVWQAAHAFNVPMRAVQTGLHAGPITDGHAFLDIGPETLVPSAVKRAEDGAGVVIRAYSLADEPVLPEVRTGWTPADIRRVRLDETVHEGSAFVLPSEIATFMVNRSTES